MATITAHCAICGAFGSIVHQVAPKGMTDQGGHVIPTTSYLRPMCASCAVRAKELQDKIKAQPKGNR